MSLQQRLKKKPVTQLRAAELKQYFSVFGQYYNFVFEGQKYPCRSLLELIVKDEEPSKSIDLIAMKPDLIVVMLNPGSSRPVDASYSPIRIKRLSELMTLSEMVPAVPDTTQYQIMRLMVAQGYQHARILNLSDLRTPKSAVLLKQIQQLEKPNGASLLQWHSIFSKERLKELSLRTGGTQHGKITDETPVVVGWGRFEKMNDYARCSLRYFKGRSVIGVPVSDKNDALFAHPSPMLQAKKEQWLEAILERLNDIASSK